MDIKGFQFSAVEAAIKKPGRKDLALIFSEVPATACAVFTTNKVKAGRIVAVDADGVWIDTDKAAIVPTVLALTSAQNATTAAVDLATSEALANALKANYNQLQTDVAALRTALIGNGTIGA